MGTSASSTSTPRSSSLPLRAPSSVRPPGSPLPRATPCRSPPPTPPSARLSASVLLSTAHAVSSGAGTVFRRSLPRGVLLPLSPVVSLPSCTSSPSSSCSRSRSSSRARPRSTSASCHLRLPWLLCSVPHPWWLCSRSSSGFPTCTARWCAAITRSSGTTSSWVPCSGGDLLLRTPLLPTRLFRTTAFTTLPTLPWPSSTVRLLHLPLLRLHALATRSTLLPTAQTATATRRMPSSTSPHRSRCTLRASHTSRPSLRMAVRSRSTRTTSRAVLPLPITASMRVAGSSLGTCTRSCATTRFHGSGTVCPPVCAPISTPCRPTVPRRRRPSCVRCTRWPSSTTTASSTSTRSCRS